MSQSLPLTPDIIGRALDNAKLTPALKFIIGVAAAGFLFDSFDITIVAYALPKIRQEFALTPQQVGLAGSAALAGMGVGSWCWGWVADKWGRRVVFSLTVLTFSLFTGVVGLSMSLGFLVGARFLTGLGLGGMVPIDQALVTEYAPANIRGRVAAMLPLCWPMGYFCAASAGLLLVPEIGWRWLFAIGVLPAILAFIIRRSVPESPRWLASQGRHEEARASLHYVGVTDAEIEVARRQVNAEPVPVKIPDPVFGDLFRPEYIKRFVHTCILWFSSGFAGVGFSIWLPTLLSTYYHVNLTTTLYYTFIVAGTQVVARFCGFYVVDKVGRKMLIVFAYGMAGLASLQFIWASTETSLLLCAMCFSFFQDIGNLGMTVYTPEVYPVKIRGKGASIAMGFGRFGGMLSPLVTGLLLHLDSVTVVWCLMAGFGFLASGLTFLMAQETRGNLEMVSREA